MLVQTQAHGGGSLCVCVLNIPGSALQPHGMFAQVVRLAVRTVWNGSIYVLPVFATGIRYRRYYRLYLHRTYTFVYRNTAPQQRNRLFTIPASESCQLGGCYAAAPIIGRLQTRLCARVHACNGIRCLCGI